MRNKGFTLAEFIIAMFIISVAIVGTYGVIQKIENVNRSAANQLVAFYLAQEGLEVIRNPEWISLCPKDANRLGLKNGEKVKISSEVGKISGYVKVTDTIAEGTVRANFIWNENLKFHNMILKALGSDDYKSIRVLPVKIERG